MVEITVAREVSKSHDLAVFFLTEGKVTIDEQLKRLDALTKDLATALYKDGIISSDSEKIAVVPSLGKIPAKQIMVIGLGEAKDLTADKLRDTAGLIIQTAKKHQATAVMIDQTALLNDPLVEKHAHGFVEALYLADYEYREYKYDTEKEKPVALESVILVVNDEQSGKVKQVLRRAHTTASSVMFARDLINCPPSAMSPKVLKEAAESIAGTSAGAITIQVYDRAQLQKMGAGALLGVAQGSEFEPYLVHLTYAPETANAKKSIALVGKGITFDSGGYSLKSSDGMTDMKSDMSGAAAVLGVFSSLAELKPNQVIHGVIACAENMVSGNAIRVGDVLRTMSGTTVEVTNTDAEGRLVLADALTYIQTYKPARIVDIATLTGAMIVALGMQIAGAIGNDDKFVDEIIAHATSVGEKIWHMPLERSYKESMKSEIADIVNASRERWGGGIEGALFLDHFVKNTPWVHLDIAGPAFNRKRLNTYTPAGGAGFAVRTLIDLVSKQ